MIDPSIVQKFHFETRPHIKDAWTLPLTKCPLLSVYTTSGQRVCAMYVRGTQSYGAPQTEQLLYKVVESEREADNSSPNVALCMVYAMFKLR